MGPVKVYREDSTEAADSMIDIFSISEVEELKGDYEDYLPTGGDSFEEKYFKKALDSLAKVYFLNLHDEGTAELESYLRNNGFKGILIERFKCFESSPSSNGIYRRYYRSCVVAVGEKHIIAEFDQALLSFLHEIKPVEIWQLRINNIIIGYKIFKRVLGDVCWRCSNCGRLHETKITWENKSIRTHLRDMDEF